VGFSTHVEAVTRLVRKRSDWRSRCTSHVRNVQEDER